MLRLALVISALVVMMSFALPAVYATTYYGPSFTMPVSIAPGSPIDITLSTVSSSTFTSPPSGSVTCGAGTCAFPLQACTSNAFPGYLYSIHQVTITDPDGNVYNLGGPNGYNLYWSSEFGGSGSGTSYPAFQAPINVSGTDTFTLKFGQGQGAQMFTSGTPGVDTESAGPYYWWTNTVNVHPNLRLDTTGSSINPTMIQGTYTVDIEGTVVCGTGTTNFFDSAIKLFFDSGITVTTPQFPLGFGLAAGVAVLGLVLVKKKASSPIGVVRNL